MLIIVGVFQAIAGLGAILEDKVYLVGQDYIFTFDVTTWGWIHLLIGVVLVAAGIGVFYGSPVARTARRLRRRAQRDRQLRLPVRLEPAVLVDADHPARCRDHLGADHARPGHRRELEAHGRSSGDGLVPGRHQNCAVGSSAFRPNNEEPPDAKGEAQGDPLRGSGGLSGVEGRLAGVEAHGTVALKVRQALRLQPDDVLDPGATERRHQAKSKAEHPHRAQRLVPRLGPSGLRQRSSIAWRRPPPAVGPVTVVPTLDESGHRSCSCVIL